jgi:hypothetical protein
MAKSSDIVIHGSERAHYVAQLTLCLLAGLSVAALGWAGWRGAFVGGRSGAPAEPAPVTTATTSAIPMTAPSGPAAAPPMAISPAPVTSAPAAPESKSILPPGREISNAQVREMVEAARAVRKLGDMQVALESLRAADLREPNHPEIMSEMALTYEAMGLGDKAEALWRSVVSMGEANAGGYVALAKSKLESREAMPKANDRNPVSLGACQVIPDNTVTKGQRLALRVPIIAAPGAEIDPSQMDIHVYFYDKVGTDRIEPTRADPPTPSWVSAPVDWKEGEELVDFTYNMPELKPEELRELGKRSFYGYVVKIFYQDRLMGVQAEPQALVDYHPPGVGPAGADNALFPKN